MKKSVFLVVLSLLGILGYGQEKGIINNAESPNVVFRSIDMGDCLWTEGFWADRFHTCEESMVPYMGEVLCGDVGHSLNNFKIAAGLKEGEHKGFKWHDGDFYKYMEAATYVYSQNGDKEILKTLDGYIEIIAQAQQPDGYIQTHVTINGLERFGNRQYHEMYNAGHMMTSACVHYRITGQTNFLDLAKKYADYLFDTFMPQPEHLKRFGFNQTQIMGLAEMYRTLGDKKYLELAELFINMRGKYVEPDETANDKNVGDMVQERTPLRMENHAVGHAVLALYFYAGAADVYAETGEKALLDALDRLWLNVTDKKMYVTGACGQTHHGLSRNKDVIHEGFLAEYNMPHTTAYNETCANICNAMFSYRMLGIHGEAQYADIVELVLFNSALSGISLEGKDYFYANPLRMVEGTVEYGKKHGTEQPYRQPYLNCFCCPPNLVRTIAKVSGWAYSKTDNGIAVNLYGGNTLSTQLLDGSEIELSQVTKYPWEGNVKLTIDKCKKEAFDLKLRIPEWAEGSKLKLNGEAIDVEAGTYATVSRKWKKGDVVNLELPMDIKVLEGNPWIEQTRNQVSIKRGPVVYCIESPDLPEGTDILDVYLPESSKLQAEYKADFLGGVSVINAAIRIRKDHGEGMYQEVSKPEWETVSSQLVPYYAWSNRGQAEMTVWIPYIWE
jgi:DUF1680 family protein